MIYLEYAAVVKLTYAEPESVALRHWLDERVSRSAHPPEGHRLHRDRPGQRPGNEPNHHKNLLGPARRFRWMTMAVRPHG
jgi:hypothetical protein